MGELLQVFFLVLVAKRTFFSYTVGQSLNLFGIRAVDLKIIFRLQPCYASYAYAPMISTNPK